MDDEFAFASVWDMTSTPSASGSKLNSELPTLTTPSIPHGTLNAFDDDDVDASVQTAVDDDDFGDFGDFGEGDIAVGPTGFEHESSFGEEDIQYQPPPVTDWESLRLRPPPPIGELKDHIDYLLASMWGGTNPSQFLKDEDIRQVEGLGQILVTPESRSLYRTLFQSTPPNSRPPNWTRSRIRRQHLVSLGIPVNLDEVLPHANGRPMPALQITTRPSSAPPGPRNSMQTSRGVPASSNNSRAGTPKLGDPMRQASVSQIGFGPKPGLDQQRVNQMLALDPETITLLPLATLEAHLATIRSLTTNAATCLTHLLQKRDALQQDSETYNGLIAELVGEAAQKMRAGPKTRTGNGKRGTG